MSTGGLMRLVAYGAQDIYLTGRGRIFPPGLNVSIGEYMDYIEDTLKDKILTALTRRFLYQSKLKIAMILRRAFGKDLAPIIGRHMKFERPKSLTDLLLKLHSRMYYERSISTRLLLGQAFLENAGQKWKQFAQCVLSFVPMPPFDYDHMLRCVLSENIDLIEPELLQAVLKEPLQGFGVSNILQFYRRYPVTKNDLQTTFVAKETQPMQQLFAQPEVTFFKTVYRRHTNTVFQEIENTLHGTPVAKKVLDNIQQTTKQPLIDVYCSLSG